MPFGFKLVPKPSHQSSTKPSNNQSSNKPAMGLPRSVYLAGSGKKTLLGLPLKQVGLLVLGGFLMGIAPVNAWPLAWFALIPLWQIVLQPHLPIRSALIGAALWGVAYHGTALSWIVWWLKPLLSMGLPLLAGVPITLFAWAFITIWGAAIGMSWIVLMRQLSRGRVLSGWQQVLVGTALWCALEWLWSRGPLYWSPLSYTQSPYNLLGLQLGQLAGPLTVTAGIVAVNGLLAQGFRFQVSGREDRAQSIQGKAAQVTAVQAMAAQVTAAQERRSGNSCSGNSRSDNSGAAAEDAWSGLGALFLFSPSGASALCSAFSRRARPSADSRASAGEYSDEREAVIDGCAGISAGIFGGVRGAGGGWG